ncbi:MAG: GNAT family N-acetyltransferase [Thermodesulfobacteriota bacterium]
MIRYTFLSRPGVSQISDLLQLYRQAGWWSSAGDRADDGLLLERIVRGSHCFLTAESGKTIVGMGRAISDRASDAYIQDVTVHPEHRSRGIGTEIIRRLVARLEQDGLKWIGLIAERNAGPFYEPLGFRVMPDAAPMLNIRP